MSNHYMLMVVHAVYALRAHHDQAAAEILQHVLTSARHMLAVYRHELAHAYRYTVHGRAHKAIPLLRHVLWQLGYGQ